MRRSGLQGDVLSLYRRLLRAAKAKDGGGGSFHGVSATAGEAGGTLAHTRAKFRADALSVRRSDFKKVEFMLRQGHKRLKLLAMPGVRAAGALAAASQGGQPSGGQPTKRAFSTEAASPEVRNSWSCVPLFLRLRPLLTVAP